MKLRIKLTSTIIMFFLILGCLVLGVFATSSATVNLGGNISFVANDVHARVSGTITGCDEKDDTELKTLNYSATSEPIKSEIDSWKNKQLNFTDKASVIKYTVLIENLSVERTLFVNLIGAVGTSENITKVLKNNGDIYTSGTMIELPSYTGDDSNQTTFTIELSVDNKNNSVDGVTFSYQFNLYNDYQETEKLIYSLDNETKTASVSMVDVDSTSGAIIIPERITSENGQTYTVTNIAQEAFRNCTGITSITIPSTIETIGANAFAGCSNLKYTVSGNGNYLGNANNPYLTLASVSSKNITSIDVQEGCKIICAGVFVQCTSLSNVTLPSTLETLSIQAFAYCSSLKSIEIPNSVKRIEYACFAFSGLTSIEIPSSVELMEEVVFFQCTSLQTATINANITTLPERTFVFCNLSNFTIPNTIKKIEYACFAGCSALTSIEIPSSVEEMGEAVFLQCSSLKTVTINANIKQLSGGTFQECSALESVVLPEGLKIISEFAFTQCNRLNSINLPESLEIIGQAAFNNCKKLNISSLPSNLKQIKGGAFQYCESIQDVTLPEGLEFIGDYALNHCSGVKNTTLRIPSTIKQIGGLTYDPANPDTNLIGTHVFYNMATANLTSFEIDSSNPYYMVVDGVLYRKENGVPTVLVAYPPAKTDSVYNMPDTVVDAYELSLSRPYSLHKIVLSDSFVIKEMSSEYANSNWANNLSAMIYIYSGVTTVTCKETNENYMSYNGQVYSKDGTILYYASMLSGLSSDSSKTATLTLKAGVTKIFHGAIGNEYNTYNGNNNGMKRYENIVIPSTVTDIEDKTLTYINTLTWNISIEEGNTTYTINASGKIEKIV